MKSTGEIENIGENQHTHVNNDKTDEELALGMPGVIIDPAFQA